jgi:hypothetical protein
MIASLFFIHSFIHSRQGLTVSQTDLELLLPQPPACWNYRCVPSRMSAFICIFHFKSSFFSLSNWWLIQGSKKHANKKDMIRY